MDFNSMIERMESLSKKIERQRQQIKKDRQVVLEVLQQLKDTDKSY